jgi:hypothetical protein
VEEIENWLQNVDGVEIVNWVAIDDMDLFSNSKSRSFMRGHFVQTDPIDCLTMAQAELAVSLLNGTEGTLVENSIQLREIERLRRMLQ